MAQVLAAPPMESLIRPFGMPAGKQRLKAAGRTLQPFIRPGIAALLALALATALWTLPQDLSETGRLALLVTGLAVIGWTLTPLPDSLVAIASAVALVGLGVVAPDDLYATLGKEMIWLLVAAFVIGAVLKASGLVERLALWATRPFANVTGLFFGLSCIIAATAFLVPSTSGRAALLLPVFFALADRMPDPRLVRPLALLFPTVILLSAGGSLIGAGAHFVAVDAIETLSGMSIDFFFWMLLALPFALLSSLAGVALILALFVPADLRCLRVVDADQAADEKTPLTLRQKRVGWAIAAIVGLWISIPLHGLDTAVIAIAGAALLLARAFTDLKPKDAFKSVETELLVFLATASLIATGLTQSAADEWLAAGLIALLPASLAGSFPAVAAFAALVALAAHLAINSRSARAAVLIPAFAIPLAGLGHDPALLILITVLGTGYCQTLMASAKPVALYGALERDTFEQTDLMRLALPLLPVMFGLLVVFALYVWPLLLAV